MSDYETMYLKVVRFFKGDRAKAKLWFRTKNPALGNISPNNLIKLDREEKLNKFIDNCLAGNFP